MNPDSCSVTLIYHMPAPTPEIPLQVNMVDLDVVEEGKRGHTGGAHDQCLCVASGDKNLI